MRKLLIPVLRIFGLYKSYKIPQTISANFKTIPLSHDDNIKKIIIQKNIRNLKDDVKGIQIFIEDINERLSTFRNKHIPFISHFSNLQDKQILEIGCGSGSSTIALTEQGAKVTGIDIDANEIELAKQRLKEFDLPEQSFYKMNAIEIGKHFSPGSFDIIIYFASLEHTTYQERLTTLKASWAMLNKGGYLCIFGTPNRLWHSDMHTSLLPFYFWLPDDLAFDYSRFSQRKNYNSLYLSNFNEKSEEFFRWGRGMSYHEIELAIQPMEKFKEIYDMAGFLRRYSFIQKIKYKCSEEYRYKKILSGKAKTINPGFFEQTLDLIFIK